MSSAGSGFLGLTGFFLLAIAEVPGRFHWYWFACVIFWMMFDFMVESSQSTSNKNKEVEL